MKWTKVTSSQIAEIGYDDDAEILGVRFPLKSGGVSEYHYQNVTPRTHRALMEAKSVGSYFGQNVKSNPEAYPFTKVEAGPTLPVTSPTSSGNGNGQTNSSTPTHTETEPDALSPGTALARIDRLKAEIIFVPGTIDKLLVEIREQVLKEAKALDISTEKNRKAIKQLAFRVVKSRTFIEDLRVGYVSAEKKRLKTVDEEATRIKDILRGIQDEVGVVTGLTAWEAKEEARIQTHNDHIAKLNEMQPHIYPDIASLQAAIALLEELDGVEFEEFATLAERTRDAVLEALRADLAKRVKAEAEAAELAELRRQSAERAESDRIANLAAAAKVKAEQDAAKEVARLESERLAAVEREQAANRRAEAAAAQALCDQEAAVLAERLRLESQAKSEKVAAEARAADNAHRAKVNDAAVKAFQRCKNSELSQQDAIGVVTAIAEGRIPNITINY